MGFLRFKPLRNRRLIVIVLSCLLVYYFGGHVNQESYEDTPNKDGRVQMSDTIVSKPGKDLDEKLQPRNEVLKEPGTDLNEKVQPRKKILSKPGNDLIETASLPLSWKASEELVERLAARRRHVRQICRQEGLDVPTKDYKINAWEFLINKEHHLIWCNVFKSASSTWFWNFNRLAGYSEKELIASVKAPVELARERYPRPTVHDLELAMKSFPETLSFMITKHPFHRLISGYRNKIQAGNTIYSPLFPDILRKYRSLGPPVNIVPKNGKIKARMRGKMAPSFPQFIQYVLDQERDREQIDMHWIPQSRFCTPCLFDFSVFAKTETLDEDGNYIIFTSGINKYIQPKVINRSASGPTEEVARELLCQLTPEQFDGLVNLYKYDFLLFQYEFESYRNCTSS